MKKVIELVQRSEDDPLRFMAPHSHELKSYSVDENHALCERFNDTRTPYEQYCAGEKYLRYDDKTLYSRVAHEYMFREGLRNGV